MAKACIAKACTYLCRQCCFIDGFSEFGIRASLSFVKKKANYSLTMMAFVWDMLLYLSLFVFLLVLASIGFLQKLGVFYRLSHKALCYLHV